MTYEFARIVIAEDGEQILITKERDDEAKDPKEEYSLLIRMTLESLDLSLRYGYHSLEGMEKAWLSITDEKLRELYEAQKQSFAANTKKSKPSKSKK